MQPMTGPRPDPAPPWDAAAIPPSTSTPLGDVVTQHEPRRPLGWHVLAGEDLLNALRRCAAGESADVVYAEMWANADHEAVPDRDNPRDNYECGACGEPWPCATYRVDAPVVLCSTCGGAMTDPPCSRNSKTGKGGHTGAGGCGAGGAS